MGSLVFLIIMHTSISSVWTWLRKQKFAITNDSVEAVSLIRETKLATEHVCLFM